MIDLTAEQRQLAKIVHDYTNRFPLTEDGDSQLLQGCYDYMEAFNRVMDSADGLHLPTISWLFSFCEMDGATGLGYC